MSSPARDRIRAGNHTTEDTDMSHLTVEIADAIERSCSHNESVTVYAGAASISDVVNVIDGYEVDYVEEQPGLYDVWGWTDDTHENEQDWRLKVHLGE